MNENKKEIISLNELFLSKKIYWIDSLLTLKKWVIRDFETNNILQTKKIKSEKGNTGTRYFIPVQNVDLFIKRFEDDNLYEKNN